MFAVLCVHGAQAGQVLLAGSAVQLGHLHPRPGFNAPLLCGVTVVAGCCCWLLAMAAGSYAHSHCAEGLYSEWLCCLSPKVAKGRTSVCIGFVVGALLAARLCRVGHYWSKECVH